MVDMPPVPPLSAVGTAAPRGKAISAPRSTWWVPAVRVSRRSWRARPSTVPLTVTVSGLRRVRSTVESTRTVRCSRKAAGSSKAWRGAPSPCQASVRKRAGTSRAVSFSQYWKAWTKVMLRMPPAATVATTTTATMTPPSASGAPVSTASVSPAPWSCGSRYSQPTPTTKAPASRRTPWEASRASAKSGRV
ncbi:hypothetical protein GCM10010510_16310 [Streptomyces anandii JCM 4720]|nr:hypothetical protein GCM10010510_16310 [Streptomyces anandii JCM 4720]